MGVISKQNCWNVPVSRPRTFSTISSWTRSLGRTVNQRSRVSCTAIVWVFSMMTCRIHLHRKALCNQTCPIRIHTRVCIFWIIHLARSSFEISGFSQTLFDTVDGRIDFILQPNHLLILNKSKKKHFDRVPKGLSSIPQKLDYLYFQKQRFYAEDGSFCHYKIFCQLCSKCFWYIGPKGFHFNVIFADFEIGPKMLQFFP
jgi:hypothetical protein